MGIPAEINLQAEVVAIFANQSSQGCSLPVPGGLSGALLLIFRKNEVSVYFYFKNHQKFTKNKQIKEIYG